jgi:uncharacterized membrane protein (DUF106 family)
MIDILFTSVVFTCGIIFYISMIQDYRNDRRNIRELRKRIKVQQQILAELNKYPCG